MYRSYKFNKKIIYGIKTYYNVSSHLIKIQDQKNEPSQFLINPKIG